MSASRRQRTLGQNFLVDRNILGVISRLAALEADDVVLEVGGGPGILSVHLAGQVRHLHVVEIDPRLEAGLREALGAFPGATLWMGDAVTMDLGALVPPPDKMVANLPYGVAATVILRTVEELPSLRDWVVMVQREVGERFAARVGDPGYGAPSVLAQLACEVRVLRPVSRTVFRPVPGVDSVLLGLHRREGSGTAAGAPVRKLVHGAFAHRRKSLSRSVALAGLPFSREAVREALAAMGHPGDERAERLAPEEFVTLAELLGGRTDPSQGSRG